MVAKVGVRTDVRAGLLLPPSCSPQSSCRSARSSQSSATAIATLLRACVRACVVALFNTPTAPERTICRHPADERRCARRRADLSCPCCSHSLMLSGKRSPRRRRGGHARPLLLACRYAGTAHGPVGPLPLACCLSLAVDGRRLLGRRQVEEDPPPPCPPILGSQTWPLARNGEQMDLRQDLTLHV